MSRDDIINLARQHGKPVQEQNAEVEYLFTLEGINALLAAEREACAEVCEQEVCACCWSDDAQAAAEHLSERIRARGQA
jgi:hypothetical protein